MFSHLDALGAAGCLMPTFQTLPRFDRDWKNLTSQQQAMFRKVVLEAFVPDHLMVRWA